MFTALWRRLVKPSARNRGARPRPPLNRFRPRLEALEDRQLLSGIVEGQPFTDKIAAWFFEPRVQRSDVEARIDWGDGHTTPADIVINDRAHFYVEVWGTHTYLRHGRYDGSVTLHNMRTGRYHLSNFSYLVADAPLHPGGVTFQATTGLPFQGVIGTYVDTNPNATATDYRPRVDWGDGSGDDFTAQIVSAGGGEFAVIGRHTYQRTFSAAVVVYLHPAWQGFSHGDTIVSQAVISEPVVFVPPVAPPQPTPNPGTQPGGNPFQVPHGQVTFDSEGLETPGPFFSRRPHWPGGASGVTIGRGYDMRFRTPGQVVQDLVNAGVDPTLAQQLSQGAGLRGRAARRWVRSHPDLEITPQQQRQLFENIYPLYEAQAAAIANSPSVVRRYGPTDWQSLNPAIRDMVTDLRYRGDYTNRTRRLIQSHIANNDLEGFTQVMSNRSLWRRVPADRFQRRVDFLQQAVPQPTPPPPQQPFIRR